MTMADQEQIELLEKGKEVWNNWRREHPQDQLDFMDAILEYHDLNGFDLSGARLMNADLIEADLTNTDLSHAVLINANLTEADLNGTDLSHAILINTNFSHATLNGANFSHAMMGQTHLNDVDLHAVKGLETVVFNSAPHISIETLYRSRGIISDIFLRNAGVPDDFIVYIRSIVNQPIEFYSCFISYSSHDSEFAEQLHADLQFYGVHCFFAPEDLKIGDKIRPRIDESIRTYDKLLLVLSQYSVSSKWVEFEVEAAMDKEREGKPHVLFPIRLDDTVMDSTTAWAAHIKRTRHIANFSKWKVHGEYNKSFSRLLRDLKAGA
jgi:TIR domain/Pentapeptide repeats (8 copies)